MFLTNEQAKAYEYHATVGRALERMAWAFRAWLPAWRLGRLPGAWDRKCEQTVQEQRLYWRTGKAPVRERHEEG